MISSRSHSFRVLSAVQGAPAVVGERSQLKVEGFRRWLRALDHKHLGLRLDSTKQGYGMVASERIEQGNALVEVPCQAFLSELTAEKCSLVGPLKERHGFRSWQLLCSHLLVEKARGNESFWYPYISMLPTHGEISSFHPLLWSEEERRGLLTGSPMLEKIETRLGMCDDDYQAMVRAGVDNLLREVGGVGLTEADVRWASAVLLSRSFSLDLEVERDEDSLALVPWADMLNHSSSAGQESCLVYDPETKTAFLEAHKSYSPGDQVYDSYGPLLTATQLFLDYGFVDDENTNHAIDLPTEVLGPVRGSSNAALLQAIGLPIESSVVPITPQGVDESVLAWTRVAVASPEELAASGWKASSKRSYQKAMMYFSEPANRETESKVLRRLIHACEELSRKYPTSLEQDLADLADADSDTRKLRPSFKKEALKAIVSEKRALQGGKRVLCDLLDKLRAGEALSSLYG